MRPPLVRLLLSATVLTLLVPGAAVAAVAAETQATPPIADYVDVCHDAASADDVRRLVFGPADDQTYGLVVEGCDAGSARNWDVLVTRPGDDAPSRRITLRSASASASTVTVTDEATGAPLHVGAGLRRDDRSIQVLVPAAVLSPIGDTLRVRVETSADRLPDAGRPDVVFPSPCGGGASAGTTVLRVAPGRSGMVAGIARGMGAEVGAVDDTLGAVELETADPDALVRLAAVAGVTAVESAGAMTHTAVIPDDPLWSSQWALPLIGAPEAWATRTASDLSVAVIDDGVDGTRDELTGRVVAGYDVVRRAALPRGADSDLGGHGTSVAGVLAARGNDGIGMAGIDWGARIVPVRVFDEAGCASSVDVAAGIRAATDAGADVINLSLGGPSSSQVLDDAIAYAVARDIVVVAAAGNAGPGAPAMYPAAHPDVIAVGATTATDTVATYSNRGSYVELAAPGGSGSQGVLSLSERDAYGGHTGTSFAAPFVAGAAALYRAQDPAATVAEVRKALADTAVDLGAAGRDPDYGHGRLDVAALLAAAAGAELEGELTDPDASAGPCADATDPGFVDLTGGVHDPNIGCLVHLDVTRGVDADHYVPTGSVTRGQMATFLMRLIAAADGHLPSDAPDAFRDDDGTTHEPAIDTLAAVGVVSGTGAGTYAPEAVVTRAQMATFLARTYAHIAGAPLADGPDAFSDDDGTSHEANINRVVAAGIASGRNDGTFGPAATVRRDQMASFLVGVVELLASDGTA